MKARNILWGPAVCHRDSPVGGSGGMLPQENF